MVEELNVELMALLSAQTTAGLLTVTTRFCVLVQPLAVNVYT